MINLCGSIWCLICSICIGPLGYLVRAPSYFVYLCWPLCSGTLGAIASVYHPDLFSKIIMLFACPRYLNDNDYFGGFEPEDLDQLFEAMRENYHSWCAGFAPLMIGADMYSLVMQEFCRTLQHES
ncbi:hypothetical protein ACH5RR_034914 [Cinchona calisaya]|uniref:Uncharacterized protein n=1 Tax=Cinchona calisaya TaxID=153742 RepID=A0ABD2YDG5_9GENT